MIERIYLDVDGVLSDFTSAAFAKFGREDLIDEQQGYDMAKMIGISKSKFWAKIDTEFFWLTLPVFEGAHAFVRELFTYCQEKDIKIYYCTVGLRYEYYASARVHWLKEFNKVAGVDIQPILMSDTRDKRLLANGKCMFIDDNDRVIDAVTEAGALSVQVPQLWNRRKDEAVRPIVYSTVMAEIQRGVLRNAVQNYTTEHDRFIDGHRCRCGGSCGTWHVNVNSPSRPGLEANCEGGE